MTSITRPSTIPALNVNVGFVLAYAVSALASATGSLEVYASEVMPFEILKNCSGRRAFGGLLGQVVLDHLVVAARAAHRLAQLEILLDASAFRIR